MRISVAFYAMAALFLSVAAGWTGLQILDQLDIVSRIPATRWLLIHLVTVGAGLQALFGSLPSLAARVAGPGSTRAISPACRWLQWLLVNAGWMFILIGMSGSNVTLASTGAVLVILAVLSLMRTLYGIFRAGEAKGHPVALYYNTAPVFFLVGLTMALSLLLVWWAPGGRFGILEAHVHANVWGFLALVAAGSLYALIPTFSGNRLAKPGWQKSIFWLLTLGATGLVAGPWLLIHELTFGGLALYVVGTVMLLWNLGRTLVGGRQSPAAWHLLLAYLWMIVPVFFAPFVLLAPGLIPAASVEAGAVLGLVDGWLLQMLMGALPLVILRLRESDAGSLAGAVSSTPAGADASGPAGDPGIQPLMDESPTPLEHGSWWSVLFVNLGVGLLWIDAFFPAAPTHTLLQAAGYSLVAAALLFFLARPFKALVAQMQTEPGEGTGTAVLGA